MNTGLIIILGYTGLCVLSGLALWWAYKWAAKNQPFIPESRPQRHTNPPTHMDLEMHQCSVNVIVVDADGNMFIGFYNYSIPYPGWIFIHDKFQPKKPFVWMYRPDTLKT